MGIARRRDFLRALALASVVPGSKAWSMSAVKPRVVVAGGGFGGASCALQLRQLNPAIEVVLIDPDEHYVTCPASNEVIAGLRDMNSITLARDGLGRAGVSIVRDRVVAIDTDGRHLRLQKNVGMSYDRLVVAPGIRMRWGSPEGYDETAARSMPHAWQAGIQTQLLAAQLRAMRDGGVVAISVPGGLMRCPPGPYERASLIAEYLQRHKPRSKVLIFDANNRFPRQDDFSQAWQEFYPGMIEWIPVTRGGAVERIDARKMTLHTSSGSVRAAVANIIPAQAPGQLALDAGLASGHGWCPVKAASFESEILANVHVIGDACIAGPMPKSASAAHSQARQCALAIVSTLAGREPPASELDSVCYSLLRSERALAIRARFGVRDGEIRQNESVDSASAHYSPEQERDQAATWYKKIIADSFAA
jgi:sulfide dehydrogenase [flavocytochrome c] flavoprotein chain